jgi:orotate phosphoribosyltransferase
LARQTGGDIPYAFNRKEAKDHGEGGVIVGHPLVGRVLIIDDVITAGTSVREALDLIRDAGAVPAGVVIALDRQERGADGRSAVAEVEDRYRIPVLSIVTLDDLIDCLDHLDLDQSLRTAMREYRSMYGV